MGRVPEMKELQLHKALLYAVMQEDTRSIRVRAELAGISQSMLYCMLSRKQYGTFQTWQKLLDLYDLEVVVRKRQ